MSFHELKKLFYLRAIPETIENSGKLDVIIRARILAGLFIQNIVVCFGLAVFFLLATLFTDKNFIPGFVFTVAMVVILGLQLYLFFSAGRMEISAMVFSMTFFAFTLLGVIISGGWQSPMLFIFFCAPIVSFIVGGRGEGLYMASLIFICGILMLGAQIMGFQVFNLITPDKAEIVRFYIWCVSILILTGCLSIYDSVLKSLAKKLKK